VVFWKLQKWFFLKVYSLQRSNFLTVAQPKAQTLMGTHHFGGGYLQIARLWILLDPSLYFWERLSIILLEMISMIGD